MSQFSCHHISYCSKNDLFEVAKADILDEIAGLAYHKKIEPAEWLVVCFIKSTREINLLFCACVYLKPKHFLSYPFCYLISLGLSIICSHRESLLSEELWEEVAPYILDDVLLNARQRDTAV